MANNICDISFSKYVQFDFEALTSSYQDLIPVLYVFHEASFLVNNKFIAQPQKKEIERYRKPPPLSGRMLLCVFQTFLI